MRFYSSIELPVLKKTVKFNHINNKHYFEILKFITNNDDEGLNEYFEWLLTELIIDKENIKHLTNLEKFLIFLDLRSACLGDIIQLTTSTNGKVDILLSSIKNNIINKTKELELCRISNSDGIQTKLCIPNSFIIDSIDKIYKDIIKWIKIDDEEINFFYLTDSESDNIIKNIPASVTNEILNFIKINEEINKINIITENNKIGLSGIQLSVFDKSMFLFLKSIFNDNLLNFYEVQYALITKMNISYEHFLQMNMNEARIFINLYNKEMKKQQEENSKSSSTGGFSMPSMPSLPKFR